MDKIKKSLKNKRFGEIQELAHAIKGVSGNISAENLFKISAQLDDILKKNEIEKIDYIITDFEKELLTLLDSIADFEKKLKQKEQPEKSKKSIAKVDIDDELEELLPLINELEQLLKGNNVKAKELLGSIKNRARSAPLLELVSKISDSLDRYDFDEGYDFLLTFAETNNL